VPLIEAMKRANKENEHLKQQLSDLTKQFDELKLDSWEKVQAYDQHLADAYIELANKIQPVKVSNYKNIAVLGSVSVGKSTIVNSLIGKKAAEVGVGETTTKTSVYKANGLQVYDVL
jgi:ribosome biogenesis GTPase A